jgi:hypothetical protein
MIRVRNYRRRRVKRENLQVTGAEVHDVFTSEEAKATFPDGAFLVEPHITTETGAMSGHRTILLRSPGGGKALAAADVFLYHGRPSEFLRSMFSSEFRRISESQSVIVYVKGAEAYVKSKGHGRKLSKAIDAWAREKGAHFIFLEPTLDSFEFWRHMGYSPREATDNDVGLVMVKRVSHSG